MLLFCLIYETHYLTISYLDIAYLIDWFSCSKIYRIPCIPIPSEWKRSAKRIYQSTRIKWILELKKICFIGSNSMEQDDTLGLRSYIFGNMGKCVHKKGLSWDLCKSLNLLSIVLYYIIPEREWSSYKIISICPTLRSYWIQRTIYHHRFFSLWVHSYTNHLICMKVGSIRLVVAPVAAGSGCVIHILWGWGIPLSYRDFRKLQTVFLDFHLQIGVSESVRVSHIVDSYGSILVRV